MPPGDSAALPGPSAPTHLRTATASLTSAAWLLRSCVLLLCLRWSRPVAGRRWLDCGAAFGARVAGRLVLLSSPPFRRLLLLELQEPPSHRANGPTTRSDYGFRRFAQIPRRKSAKNGRSSAKYGRFEPKMADVVRDDGPIAPASAQSASVFAANARYRYQEGHPSAQGAPPFRFGIRTSLTQLVSVHR